MKKYIVDIIVETAAPVEPVKEVEEKQKNKKKAKKLKTRMNSRYASFMVFTFSLIRKINKIVPLLQYMVNW